MFNHRTNVELSNRLVCFDIKQLGKQLKKLGMLIVQDQILSLIHIFKAVKRSKGMSGKPITSKPVYGYLMDEDENFIIDEEAAPVVKQIYNQMCIRDSLC